MREEIISKIKAAGVIGAGGAGFPTHVKVSSPADIVIVNGAECEPLLKVDQQLMEFMAEKVVKGLETVMAATGAGEGIIALKGKYKGSITALSRVIAGKPVRLAILDDFYPAGDEHVLVHEATGRLAPQGGLPIAVGCVVTNVETLVNVAGAMEGKAVTHTYLTVAGDVPEPVTLKLPVGTAVKDALAFAGCRSVAGKQVIEGGPMMGKIVGDIAHPITKTTKGLVVLPQGHPLIRKRTLALDRIVKQSKTACVQCRFCTDLCPRYLLGHSIEPHKVMRALRGFEGHENIARMAFACSECGLCEQYACIMNLSPRTVNAMLKQELSKNGIKPGPAAAGQTVKSMQAHRKIPVKRLVSRLGLAQYDREAPLMEKEYTVNAVALKLRQHVGAPCMPIVQIGQSVRAGEIVARTPGNSLGAHVHASITGVVAEITDRIIINAVAEGSEL